MSHTVACTFKRETDSAVLVVDTDTGEELWLPFSQVESMHRDNNDNGSIVITDWIAAKKGLI